MVTPRYLVLCTHARQVVPIVIVIILPTAILNRIVIVISVIT